MEQIAREIGNNLKRYRLLRGYTQEKLAEEILVSVGYISQLENGLKTPSVQMIAKISEVLGLTGALMLSDNNEIDGELKELVQILMSKDPEDVRFIKNFALLYFAR
ncbi:putative transcriptional regulator [Desulfitobacterium dichloroeliminans LMG P-21439]|uniref:Putative transcriptional regulator n=1 Tax=Desulfitobacterium dichloroeliminans (strain LMG P-21439 / DCA1) TaxID=871963 RepID=L0F8I9_DESDL|nr:helix-turn-helix transcriptional regulator [Desulfitobacterium dichloroeliminans]AGA68971.1 putative transcriptional regulator [Desulfitobacterium dichloroeliminans LMG P-21439]